MRYDWARYAPHGYECSTAGDTRFCALFARLSDGRLIVEAYQLSLSKDRLKGSWQSYLSLWARWAQENPALMLDLATRARYGMLTDRYAVTPISQARALAHLLNESHAPSESAPIPDASTPPVPRASAATTPAALWLARARDKR